MTTTQQIDQVTGAESTKCPRFYSTKSAAMRRANSLADSFPNLHFYIEKTDIGVFTADVRFGVGVEHESMFDFNNPSRATRWCV